MRSAGNFNSEWGYLAPAPSLMRTLRVVLVATAVGATAGAAVVISLVDRPAGSGDKAASATAHAIVTSVQAAPPVSAAVASRAAPVKLTASAPTPASADVAAPQVAPPITAAGAPQPTPAPVAASSMAPEPIGPPQKSLPAAVLRNSAGDVGAAAPKPADGIAALSYASPSADDEQHASDEHAADVPDEGLLRPEPAEKKAKRHVGGTYASNSKDKPTPGLGSLLRRIFHPHPDGTSYYPNR
jgi:hypothetical protein